MKECKQKVVQSMEKKVRLEFAIEKCKELLKGKGISMPES